MCTKCLFLVRFIHLYTTKIILFALISVILVITPLYTVYTLKIISTFLSGESVSLFDVAFLVFNNRSSTQEKPHEEIKPDDNTENPQNLEAQSTKTKQKDPFSLELFENKKSSTNITDTNPTVHYLKQPIITRSLSQPHVTANQRFTLFNLYQKPVTKRPENLEDEQYASDFYLYTLMWACVIMLFWKNMMLLPILPIPILIYFIKHVGWYLGIWGVLSGYYAVLREYLVRWSNERIDALAPVPIRGLYKTLQTINSSLKDSIKNSIDTVSSCVVIFVLLIFVICASIFFVFQVIYCNLHL